MIKIRLWEWNALDKEQQKRKPGATFFTFLLINNGLDVMTAQRS